jgi:hypothetical protein
MMLAPRACFQPPGAIHTPSTGIRRLSDIKNTIIMDL